MRLHKQTPHRTVTLLASALALLFIVPAGAEPAPTTKPSAADAEFQISFWCGPPAKFTTLERYQEIKDANFTLAFPPNGGGNAELNRKILDLCQQVGLKAMIADHGRIPIGTAAAGAKESIDKAVADYAHHPALFGYSLTDEPGAGAFPAIAQTIAYLRERDPAHIAFVNLYPNYAPLWALGTPTYDAYLRQFIQQTRPQVLSYDHYHFKAGGDTPLFFDNLASARKAALEANIPFWNIVLCVQHADYRHLTEPELRFEAMQTLAYGARGLLWFTYWSPAESDKTFHWQHAIINEDGSRDPHYEMVKQINAEVLAFGDTLTGATSTDVRPPSPEVGPAFTVGKFKSRENATLTFIASADYKNTIKLPVSAPTTNPIQRFDPATRQWRPVEAKPERGRTAFTIELPPGHAALLKW